LRALFVHAHHEWGPQRGPQARNAGPGDSTPCIAPGVPFHRKSPCDPTNRHRKLAKGFIRNGHDVVEFSYLDLLAQLSPVNFRGLAARLAKEKADRALVSLASQYSPDMVVLFNLKRLDERTVLRLKETAPGALYVAMHGDMHHGCDADVLRIARLCDWFMPTSAGAALRWYKEAGVARCAFVPNVADGDLEYPQPAPPQWRSDVLFTGKLWHDLEGQDPHREELIRHLAAGGKLTVWGCLGRPDVSGLDYVNAICGARIALSVNAFNDVRLYHSDRLTHYLSHGTFVLAKGVPDSELMFEDGRHLCYFNTTEQCDELIDRFLADDAARRRIAAAGMERVHEAFGCRSIARHVVDIATTGRCGQEWAEVV